MSPSPGAEEVLSRVGELGARVFAELEVLRARTADALALTLPSAGRRDLPLAEPVAALLSAPGSAVVGAGFVAAPGVLQDAPYWLEWWTTARCSGGARRVERLVVQVDPQADDFRDYTAMPWFRVPQETGRRHVTGPYVDYLCTDEYTLTFTMPVRVGGRFVGVVGADVFVRWLEQQVQEALTRTRGPAALVNAAGRVLTASTGPWTTGDLVREVPVARWWSGEAEPAPGWRLLRCGDLPLGLLVGDGRQA